MDLRMITLHWIIFFITQIFYEGNSPVDAQFGRLSRNIAEAHRDKENSLRERIDKEGARVRIKNLA